MKSFSKFSTDLGRALHVSLSLFRRQPMRVGVFMMHKDETHLLPVFIKYYGARFGYDSIHLFDNGSSEAMNTALAKASAMGVQVFRGFNTQADFERKGEILGNAINRMQHRYDVCLPLDCDEFIAVQTEPNSYSCDAKSLKEYFRSLPRGAYQTQNRLRNHTTDFNLFSNYTAGHPKLFFKRTEVEGLDVGAHDCRAPENVYPSALSHFELHHKPFPEMLQHSENKMALRLAGRNPQDIESYQGRGHHLIKYLRMKGPSDYEAYLDAQTWFSDDTLAKAFAELGMASPFGVE